MQDLNGKDDDKKRVPAAGRPNGDRRDIDR
jgi:hypothetical protein